MLRRRLSDDIVQMVVLSSVEKWSHYDEFDALDVP